MDELSHLLTDRVRKLILEAESLRPDAGIKLEATSAAGLPPGSAGAAVNEDGLGNAAISIDVSSADEYIMAHELMHVILHRSGWPQMYCMIPADIDPIARRLADDLDSILDHYVFAPRLESLGFDPTVYRQAHMAGFREWPDTKPTGPGCLWNALKILDALFFGSDHRRQVLNMLEHDQPERLALARQLQHAASPAKARTKSGVRRAMVKLLDFLEQWLGQQVDGVPNLRWRVGISPLFTKGQLRRRASTVIDFASHPMVLRDRRLWIGALVLRSDGTRFCSYVAPSATSEPTEFETIRHHLLTQTVREFLEIERISKYGTYG